MKTPPLLSTAIAAAMILAAPLAFAQTGPSTANTEKSENSATGNMTSTGSSSSGTMTSTGSTTSSKKTPDKDTVHPASKNEDPTEKGNAGSDNDTSHHVNTTDQTKAAQANKNGPGD